MIVCSCYAISDKELREAAASGVTLKEIEAEIGAGTECGVCRPDIVKIFAAQREEQRVALHHRQKRKPNKRSGHEG